MKPSFSIFYSPQPISRTKEYNSKQDHSYKKLTIAMKPLFRNMSTCKYKSRKQIKYQNRHSHQIKSLHALNHNTTEKPNSINQIKLPKIAGPTDNYEQISISQLNEISIRKNVKDQSYNKKTNISELPNIKMFGHRKTIFLNQLLELVGSNGKWDFDYRTIHQCMKIATKYDPKYEILFEEERKSIDLDNTINIVKTSLTKTLKNQSCDTSRKQPYLNLSIPKHVHRNDYPMFLMKERENEHLHTLKKLEDVESAYEKQRINHRNKNQVISKVMPLDHVKNQNEEKIVLFQRDFKNKLSHQVIDVKDQIKNLKGKILTILEDSLCEFKTQLNPILTPKEEKKETNSSNK